MNSKLVSVIVPMFNAEKYISRCIESICAQTYKNIEIILINDGSSDNTEKICIDYKIHDSRIVAVSQRNMGVSRARNKGLKTAQGEFIAFVDADDYIEKDFIETLVNGISLNNTDLSIVDFYINANDDISSDSDSSGIIEFLDTESLIGNLFSNKRIRGYLWNKLFRKDIITSNHLTFKENVTVWEDMLFCLAYACCSFNACYIHSPKYYYCQNGNSIVHKNELLLEDSKYHAINEMYILLNERNIRNDLCEESYCEFLLKTYFHGKNYNSKEYIVSTIEKIKPCFSKKHMFLFFILKYMPLMALVTRELYKKL